METFPSLFLCVVRDCCKFAPMKRIIPILIIAIVGLMIGCQPKEADPEQRIQDSLREDSFTLKIGYLPTLESLPLLIAEQEGYFDTAKVKLLCYNAALDLDTAIQRNRVQLITSDICRTILLNAKDNDIKIIGKTQNPYQLITAKNQRIRKSKDLESRLIAIARHEITDYLLDKMLEHEQMDVDGVNRPQINSLPLRKQMMEYEELDATLLPEPFATACMLNGDRVLLSNNDVDAELSCLVINKQAISDFLDQMNIVAHAYNQAVGFLKENKPDLTAFYDIPKEVADTISLPEYQILSLPREKDVENCLKWLQGRNLVTKKHKTTELLEERFLNR